MALATFLTFAMFGLFVAASPGPTVLMSARIRLIDRCFGGILAILGGKIAAT